MYPVTLIKKETAEISISLTAKVNSKGELVLSGQDLGSRVEELWGDMDYEYWTIVAPDQKLAVLLQLLRDGFPNLLDLQSWLESVGVLYTPVANVFGEEKFLVEADQGEISIHKEPETHHADSEDPVLVIDRKCENELLLLLLQRMFRHKVFENDSEFQKWLQHNDIAYQFSSYV